MHLSDGADAYLAPELTALDPDPVHLDVHGLGVLAYPLVTGKAPAVGQAEPLARLEAGEGLRPGSLVDGLSEAVDEPVRAATAGRPGQRLSGVDEFLELPEVVEDSLTAPRLRPHPGIIRLVEPEPLRIGGRTVPVLEYVGDERDDGGQGSGDAARPRRREETAARQLRRGSRP